MNLRFPLSCFFIFVCVCVATAQPEPANNPASINFSNVKTYGFNVVYTKSIGGADGYVALRKQGSAAAAIPVDGTLYSRGDFIDDAQVAYIGSDTSFLQTATLASTEYYYTVFAYNGSGASIDYLQTSPGANVIFLPDNNIANYYDDVDPTDTSFVAELKSRVRVPYTQVSYNLYDETNVAQFASRDAPNGQMELTCVYSGQQYTYTPPFAWTPSTPFSREHTWCQSWMPSSPSSSSDEYSDQHHLFPVNQNDANGVRSNHPLGEVTNPISVYLEGKLGYNGIGQLVYEPRDAHKGDAARALLYMALRYDGIGGYTWNFNALNASLPGMSEAPQDVNVLLQWCIDDPPDNYERTRNDFVQSIQQNRNPFVDHPEFLSRIDFHTLTYIMPTALQQHYVSTKSFDVHVFPIPSGGDVFLEPNISCTYPLTIRWYNTYGAMVKSVEMKPASRLETNANELAPGLYLLQINCKGNIATTRWIKQ